MHGLRGFACLLVLGLAAASPGRSALRDHTLVVVDSRGQPADEMAREAKRLARHRRARVEVRWIRIGAPWPLSPTHLSEEPTPGKGLRPDEDEASPQPEADFLPEWDPDGDLTRDWELTGLPRVLVLDPAGRVLLREAFLDTPRLRYLSRHPDRPRPPARRRDP